jgi:hypothetical protein
MVVMNKEKIYKEAQEIAKESGIEFGISLEDIGEMPDFCPILGIRILDDGDIDRKATLDRFDRGLGYVPDNIRIVSMRAKRLRSDGTLEEFQKIINWISGISNKKNKLLKEEVLEIKRLLKLGVSQRKLAHKYNVSQAIIGKINREEIWKNIILE